MRADGDLLTRPVLFSWFLHPLTACPTMARATPEHVYSTFAGAFASKVLGQFGSGGRGDEETRRWGEGEIGRGGGREDVVRRKNALNSRTGRQ